MSSHVLRTTLKYGIGSTSVLAFGGGGSYGAYLYETDPGTNRMVKAYSTMIPVVLRYRWAEFQHKYIQTLNDDDWLELDKEYAQPTVAKLGQLQGMYTKYCQTASGLTNTFSDVWIHELRKLENEVPPRSIETVYATIEEETGRPVEETFSYFDPTPLGSASIGQVHKAILKETGQEVAVKVQYNEASKLFHDDIDTIRAFCTAFAPEHVVVLSALEKQNKLELDYHNEAQNLTTIIENMKRHKFFPREISIPQPILKYTTRRMLTMELLPGPKLIDGVNKFYSEYAKSKGTTLHEMEREAREKIEKEGIPAKYDGPSALQLEFYRKYLKATDAIANLFIGMYNHTVASPLISKKNGIKRLEYRNTTLPPNTPQIIDTLMRVHGHQLLVDGIFNADPNGGNFILLPNNKLGFIDYGATKYLTRNERLNICVLFAAIAREDKELLYDMSKIGGYKSKYGKKDVLWKLIKFGYDSYGKDVTGGKNIQQFIDELKYEDPWEEVPDNFVLAQFLTIRLRSLALGMNHPIVCSKWWGPLAEEELKRQGLPYESWDHDQLVKYKPELNMQHFKFA